ncbi:hypothetical protein BD414DRAFT_298251 [Trametes punicea]|nr:hypothetical protein BD414DRAFT_298251 [Trametes punicea]
MRQGAVIDRPSNGCWELSHGFADGCASASSSPAEARVRKWPTLTAPDAASCVQDHAGLSVLWWICAGFLPRLLSRIFDGICLAAHGQRRPSQSSARCGEPFIQPSGGTRSSPFAQLPPGSLRGTFHVPCPASSRLGTAPNVVPRRSGTRYQTGPSSPRLTDSGDTACPAVLTRCAAYGRAIRIVRAFSRWHSWKLGSLLSCGAVEADELLQACHSSINQGHGQSGSTATSVRTKVGTISCGC